jgi:peptidoglycan/LPS O-acetylase OafA/YrhL
MRFDFDGTPFREAAENWMRPGAMGVDLFFLVSGFIMVYTTVDSDGSIGGTKTFLIKRFARIWPVYALIVLLRMIVAVAFLPDHPSWMDVAKSLVFLPVDARKPPYFDLPYPIGWTLNFEAYFYLVFGMSLLAGRYRWAAFFGWMAITLIGLPWIVTGAVSLNPQHDYAIGLDYIDQMVNPIIWDFVAGVLVGLFYVSHWRVPYPRLVMGLMGATVAAAVWWSSPGHANFHGITQWGAPLAVLFALLAMAYKDKSPNPPRFMVWLGQISFSLYLVHLIAFDALSTAIKPINPEWKHSPLYALAQLTLAIALAWISYRLLEKGLSESLRRLALRFVDRFGHSKSVAYAGTDNPPQASARSES